jgi:hypothetical protein
MALATLLTAAFVVAALWAFGGTAPTARHEAGKVTVPDLKIGVSSTAVYQHNQTDLEF